MIVRDWVSKDDPDMEAEIGGVSGITWGCVLEGENWGVSGRTGCRDIQ